MTASLTMVERMLHIAPVRLSCRDGRYRCEWSVNHAKGQNAIGEGIRPFEALVNAHKDAVACGWIQP